MIYRKEIDGLRAIALLPVIFFHAGFETFKGGFVGVDVFFVISGYLISTIIFAELDEGKFSLINFYERRARRILPPLFFMMLTCILFAWIWLIPSDLKGFGDSLVAVSLFSSNILFFRESGYFDTATDLKPLLHTWSLAVEEQYYVFFPLILICFWGLGKRWLLIILGVFFLASLSFAEWATHNNAASAFYLLSARAWELLIGAFAAFYLAKTNQKSVNKTICEAGGMIGIALICIATFTYSHSTPFPGIHALVPTLGALLIIVFATQETMVGMFLSNRIFVAIGLISYSAYLWHQPLFAFLKHSNFDQSPTIFCALIILTLFIAFLSWKFIESPFRKKNGFSRRQIFSLSISFAIFFIAYGLYAHRTEGIEDRAHMKVFKDFTYNTAKLGYQKCENSLTQQEPKLNYCLASTSHPNALIIGDSHAEDKFYGISKNLRQFDWMLIGNSSCPPLLGITIKSVDGTECNERIAKLFAYINQSSNVRIVVLSFAHFYALDKFIAADHVMRKFDPSYTVLVDQKNPKLSRQEALYAGLKNTIAFLHQRNIKTILTLDVPELKFMPVECLKKLARCEFSKQDVLLRQVLHRKMAFELASEFKNVYVFDPLQLFCHADGKNCSYLLADRSLYRDSHHLTHYGSLKYGELFSAWFNQSANEIEVFWTSL